MAAEANEFYDLLFGVKPYKQCVIFNVTFHIAFIISGQDVRPIFIRYGFILP